MQWIGIPLGARRAAWREYLDADEPSLVDAAETDAVTLTRAQAVTMAGNAEVLGSSRWGVDDVCRLIAQPTEQRAQELSEARCD